MDGNGASLQYDVRPSSYQELPAFINTLRFQPNSKCCIRSSFLCHLFSFSEEQFESQERTLGKVPAIQA